MREHCFPLKEHLKSKSIIDALYTTGASVTSFPLRAVFMELPANSPHATANILISVAKRRFKHAVDRNLVKRRIREAYRLSKQPFTATLNEQNKKIAVAIIYIDTKHCSTEILKKKMCKLLTSIIEKNSKLCESL
ncbi:MAG: ribonuclease P protein component [Bacteroidaceae bacterium]|nr:ribonuclease P protein component [Bacteroidaceae bacterium]